MRAIGSLVAGGGVLVALAGVLILGLQFLMWLRYGEWTEMPIGWLVDTTIGYPFVGWLGAQMIINYVMSAPTSVSLFAVGIAVALIGGSVASGR